ncbi:hypothetical protein BJ138DRAFT_1238639 [Hygrophoropsis aurantiaca]|uniref:Uncharacterized protein n=1 Tax=Hygrophoropsis aurantiaca TaxID=72124 RepID=A0ACB8ADN0_9AGAM|nr:hypothetical protein BJ138DRAFT_1238639 [Hygrophoropsis aurantiaca]
MIITDTSPSPNKDTKTNPADVTAASMSAPPPPPYPQAPHPHQSYQPYPYYNPTPFVERRRSPAKRFWGAFGVALLIWVLFAMFTDSFIQMTRGIGHRSRVQFFGDGQVGAPWPSDGDVETCVGAGSWSESYISSWVDQFPHHASTSFNLDVNSDVLRLLSRGSQQYGVVNIKQSNEVGDNVRVDVVVGYYYEEILNRATVCQLKRGESDHGIGIFVRTRFLEF